MGIMSVVSIPLKTEKWQSDLLAKRFELCRQVYNAMLGYELKKLRAMERQTEYKQAQEVISTSYKNMTVNERKKSKELKEAINIKKNLMKEYGFSKFGFTNDIGKFYNHFNENISSTIAGRSIAIPMWEAFDDYFYGSGRQIKFKRKGDWRSMVTDGQSGIRIVDENDATVFGNANGKKLYCVNGTYKGKKIKMPLKIDRKDTYKLEMLDRKYKCVRITNKEVKGTYKWYVQITVDEAPVTRYDSDGNIKNQIGDGTVLVYTDTAYVVYTTDRENFTAISLKDTQKDIAFDNRIAEIQRYLDSSKRATNPDNFNEDGTIKKGIMVDGERHKLKWQFSNGYRKAVKELRNIYRVQAENRKLERIIIANEILSHGNKVIVNDFPYQWAMMKKKEDKFKENGVPEKKKKAGYAIGHNAPAMLVTLIDQKLKSAGYEGVTKVKLENFEEIESNEGINMNELKDKVVEIRQLNNENEYLKERMEIKDNYRQKAEYNEGLLEFIKTQVPEAYALLKKDYNLAIK